MFAGKMSGWRRTWGRWASVTSVRSTRVWVEGHATVPGGPSCPSIVHVGLAITLTILCIGFVALGGLFLIVEERVGAVILERSNEVPERSCLIDVPD